MKRFLSLFLATAALASFATAADAPKPLRILLITGGCCHDYAKQKDILKEGLEKRANVEVTQVHTDDKSTKPPLAILGNPDYAKGYDLVIHDECSAEFADLKEGVADKHAAELQAKLNAAIAKLNDARKALAPLVLDEKAIAKLQPKAGADFFKAQLKPGVDAATAEKAFDAVNQAQDEVNPLKTARDEAVSHDVLNPHRAGIPGVNLHCAMHCYRIGNPGEAAEAGGVRSNWFDYLGLQSSGHGAQLPIALTFVAKENPIEKGMADWTTINEELYNNIQIFPTATPLVKGKQVTKDKEGKEKEAEYVVAWTNLYQGKTRVFSTTIGHNNVTVSDDRYLELVTRGVLWACDKLKDDGTPKDGYGKK